MRCISQGYCIDYRKKWKVWPFTLSKNQNPFEQRTTPVYHPRGIFPILGNTPRADLEISFVAKHPRLKRQCKLFLSCFWKHVVPERIILLGFQTYRTRDLFYDLQLIRGGYLFLKNNQSIFEFPKLPSVGLNSAILDPFSPAWSSLTFRRQCITLPPEKIFSFEVELHDSIRASLALNHMLPIS